MANVSDQIQSIFNSLTTEQKQIFHSGIDNAEMIFKLSGHPFSGLRKLYRMIDEANISSQAVSSCKKGCAFCCHIRVSITKLEAKYIVHYCKTMGIEIDTDKLDELKDLDEVEYMMHPNRRCTFLASDNTCKIYEARPTSCRNYYVTSDPSLCDTSGPSNQVETFINWQAIMPSIALLRISEDTGNMANMILNELK